MNESNILYVGYIFWPVVQRKTMATDELMCRATDSRHVRIIGGGGGGPLPGPADQ